MQPGELLRFVIEFGIQLLPTLFVFVVIGAATWLVYWWYARRRRKRRAFAEQNAGGWSGAPVDASNRCTAACARPMTCGRAAPARSVENSFPSQYQR